MRLVSRLVSAVALPSELVEVDVLSLKDLGSTRPVRVGIWATSGNRRAVMTDEQVLLIWSIAGVALFVPVMIFAKGH